MTQLSLFQAILYIQTDPELPGATEKQNQGLTAYARINNFAPDANRETILAHLEQVYGVVPGEQRLKTRAFVHVQTQVRGLLLMRADGMLLYQRRWWSKLTLEQMGLKECTGDVVRLGPLVSPGFVAGVRSDQPFTNTFRKGRRK